MNETRKASRRVAAASISLLILGGGVAQGQRLLSLGPGTETAGVAAATQFEAGVGPVIVQVDLDLVRSAPPRLELPTPDGRVLVAVRSVFEDRGDGNVMWAGSLPGADYESVVLTVEGGSFVGRFGEPGGVKYRISADPDGRGTMVDTGGVPGDAPETVCPVGLEPLDLEENFLAEGPGRIDQPQRVAQQQSHDRLDILVLYTAQAARNWANRGGALASIRNAGDYLNLVLRNGQLPITANIVHVARAPAVLDTVGREGVGPYQNDLGLQTLWNGEVLQLRTRHAADVVHLFSGERTSLLGACGRAALLTQGETAEEFSFRAGGWTANSCASFSDAEIFAHEIGHNLGANHDPDNVTVITPEQAVAPYAFGHHNHEHIPNVGTIMSYRGQTEPYFSSVRIRPKRRTIGIGGEQENERALRRTSRIGVQYSDALTVPPEGAPEAPSNLRVQVTGAGTVRASWVDNSDDEAGFEVYVQRQGQPFSERTLVEADEESVEVDGLESGYHFFWAYSYIGSNRSLRTSYVDVVVPGAEPAAPGDLDVLAIGSFAIVTWSDNSEDETGFEVQSLRGGELWYRDEVAANRRFGIVSGLEPGVRHVFRVSAYGDGGLSWSEDVVVVPEEPEGPAPPTDLRATVTDGTSVRLTWTDNSDDEVGFDVQAIVWGWSGLFAVDADTESIEIPALARGGRYFFNVIAVDAEGRTAWSETLVVTLGVSGRGPRGPRRLRAMPIDPTSVRLTWEDDSTDELGFEIQVREFGERWRRVTLVDANEESALLTGLTPGSVEDYRVFAYNDTGFSGSSNSVTVKLPGGIPPTELTAAPAGDSAIELKWSGRWADTSLGLIVVQGRNPESEWVELTTTRAVNGSARISGLMTDTPYTFRLASTVGATRAFSGEASATTGAFRDACRDGARYLCLGDGRFEVQVHWSNPDVAGDHGFGTGVPIDFSDESGLFWFFEPDNVELILKVLDGQAINGNFWVFFGALSDVEYWVSVEDTQAGQRRTYHNPPKEICGQSDILAFSAGDSAVGLASAAGSRGAPGIDLVKMNVAWLPATGIERSEEAAGECEPGQELLCLLANRFSVEVAFVDPNLEPPDDAKRARVAPSLTTANTGFFWFFNKENIELAVKVLDGRAFNGSFWVLYGGLSDVQYKMTVEDTVTGDYAAYENEKGSLCGRIDLEPFGAR
ncbi:MAG: hypothetical protein F4X59_13180 [Holophagales bacterium]|nr:hypothetical protein [Holophagales bacterium]MXX62500.1 hypothetical protein [Holophagales bacterium]MYC11067.1 hypothetical protein [Holophagales bacterium]MYD23966.1 hypothetical protein [Holophagales bacterium]MYI33481.1 hypothetical protein [Holophagales bacterium]